MFGNVPAVHRGIMLIVVSELKVPGWLVHYHTIIHYYTITIYHDKSAVCGEPIKLIK
jgi:hypothetical protein